MNISVRGTLCGLVESVELEGDDTRVRGREIYRPCRVELSQLYLEEASGTDRLLAGAPGWGSWRLTNHYWVRLSADLISGFSTVGFISTIESTIDMLHTLQVLLFSGCVQHSIHYTPTTIPT